MKEITSPRSRRALLGAVAGAAAATVVSAVARPLPASAVTNQVLYTNNENGNYVLMALSAVQVGKPQSGSAVAITGESVSGQGVKGTSSSGDGVSGQSDSGYGVYGYSDTGQAVRGGSNSNIGVFGGTTSSTLPAIQGWAKAGNTGVQGYSGNGTPPTTPGHTGVFGFADAVAAAVGVQGGSTTGRGAVFAGKLAQLKLQPSTDASHPASGQLGDLFVDKAGRLWFCKGASWKQIA